LDVVEGKGRVGDGAAAAARRAEYRAGAHAPQVVFDEYDRPMRTTLVVLGLLLVLGGLVWIAQGLNLPFAPRSFMTADRRWILIGAAAVVVGVVLVGRGRRRR
jgi:hypothetical protein